jgi:glycerol-3-phosphate dehydrogenase
MTRTQRLQTLLQGSPYDLVVIGGGATGLGVALDAALRGFRVALLESHDFASGTSSRSTKLLHGGVRYLAQGDLRLVREALTERATVLRNAPHLAHALPFVMPAYRWWEVPFYGMGLKIYDRLAGRASLGRTEWLSRGETLAALPGIRASGLAGGVRYWDAQFDDARLALALARSAEAVGAVVVNYTPAVQIRRDAGRETAPFEVALLDARSGTPHQVYARCVVNATGVWVDQVRASAAEGARVERMVTPSQGVHVVVDRAHLPGEQALLIPRTRDGRVLFAVPWLGKLILGTTDTPREDLPREPEAFDHELAFILNEASQVLGRPVGPADIRSVWVGLRPLVAPPSSGPRDTKTLSREHTIVTDPNGLVSVTGGKWTTYRVMAQDVLAHCFEHGLLPLRPGGLTEDHRLCGAPDPNVAAVPLHAPPGLHLYGTEADRVQQLPGADRMLGLGLTEAMVRHAVRHEFAQTVEDVLARRWRALFLDAGQAAAMAPAVAAILREEGIADPEMEAFIQLCRAYLPALHTGDKHAQARHTAQPSI